MEAKDGFFWDTVLVTVPQEKQEEKKEEKVDTKSPKIYDSSHYL
ncbi:MAG: hypothetical protein WCK59_03485 [Candidatus Falkowbacteria bacterium]